MIQIVEERDYEMKRMNFWLIFFILDECVWVDKNMKCKSWLFRMKYVIVYDWFWFSDMNDWLNETLYLTKWFFLFEMRSEDFKSIDRIDVCYVNEYESDLIVIGE